MDRAELERRLTRFARFGRKDSLGQCALDGLALLAQVKIAEGERDAYRDFYEAWWEREQGVTNFDLHQLAVERLEHAQEVVVALRNGTANSQKDAE